METVIRDRQAEYYQALAAADKMGESTPFIEFLFSALIQALQETRQTDQATDQVKAQVKVLSREPLTALECVDKLGLKHRPSFRQNYLQPALKPCLIERTLPDMPNSTLQKYRRTKGG